MRDRPILTATQSAVHSCILAYVDRNGVSPTITEIRAITGYSRGEITRARNELLQIMSAEYVGHRHHGHCPICDDEIQSSWTFCASCGQRLREAA